MRTRSLLAVTGAALLALTACGSSGDGAATTTAPAASGSETAAASDAVAWADTVCQKADALDASVASVASSINIDPQAGDVLDQLQQQIGAGVDAVKASATDLATAVAAVPKGSDPALVAASEQLTSDKAALDSSIDSLKTAATSFSEADGLLGKVTAFGGVSSAASDVGNAATTFATSLQNVTSTGGDAAKAAFAAAPTCQARASK
ncbi:MAG: hypothetical protein AB7O74_10065 [Candidatus Nanopelagicales bacterium]